MPATIDLISFDADSRTVVFEAYGRRKTISGLGEFGSQAEMIEYLQSVAETDLKNANGDMQTVKPADFPNDLVALPDMSDFVGQTLPDPSTIE